MACSQVLRRSNNFEMVARPRSARVVLRLFALASSLIAMPYFLHQPTPLWAALGWTVLFSVINLYQSWRLYAERRPVKLTPEEDRVRQLVFQDLPPRKFLQVLSIGSWTDVQIGEQLLTCGRSV